MNDSIKIQSLGSIYWINPNHIEVIRYVEAENSMRIEYASGRVDYYHGSEASQIFEALNENDYAQFSKLPKLEELID